MSGDSSTESFDEITYEGYGPNGVAILVECVTDNRNRTSSDVKATFNKINMKGIPVLLEVLITYFQGKQYFNLMNIKKR